MQLQLHAPMMSEAAQQHSAKSVLCSGNYCGGMMQRVPVAESCSGTCCGGMMQQR